VMAGTTGIERAHAVDEWVAVDELAAVARVVIRLVLAT
jgi:di/tripeptidase